MIIKLLTSIFYPKFLPSPAILKFSVVGWKVSVLNGGPPGKPIILNRRDDKKTTFVGFNDLENNFLPEESYIEFVKANGFQFLGKRENSLHFEITLSEP